MCVVKEKGGGGAGCVYVWWGVSVTRGGQMRVPKQGQGLSLWEGVSCVGKAGSL